MTAGLRPFFTYYGGKWRDAVKNYPAPRFGTIVEPFAGSAGYSMRYPDRRVILCDLDPVIAGLWTYLVGVTEAEILAIPDLSDEETVHDLGVCEEARWLVGFWLNKGVSQPRVSPSAWMRSGIRPGSFWGPEVRRRVANQLQFIRHWEVRHGSYEDIDVGGPATWFVDPPYAGPGSHYRCGSSGVDFDALASWCLARQGQTIVCEASGATWLPFRDLGDMKSTRATRSAEAVYLSEWRS